MNLSVLGFIFLMIMSLPALSSAQDYTQTIERTARFANAGAIDNELAVFNVWGDVTVEAYDGDEIQITAHQEVEGSDSEIQRAREELKFVVEEEGNRVYVYIDAPFIHIKKHEGRISYNVHRWDNGWDDHYDFLYDIRVRVPRNAHVRASTINDGKVTVSGTRGNVHASNVNGELELTDITGRTKASTVNGDITVRYRQNPREDSKYNTVNGTIEVYYPQDLSADITFESMNGDMYTDFEDIEYLPVRVEQDKTTRRGRVTYQIDQQAPIRIGNGGPTYSFEVLNGDVYVKRIQS